MSARGGRGGKERQVVVERLVEAPAQRIFDVLADPAKHPDIDGSGTVKGVKGEAPRLSMGTRFGMEMKIGLPYSIENTVVEFEEGRRIAWRHVGGQRWRYELAPVDGGTLVRETFDYRQAVSPLAIELAGFARRNRRGMERTLERLAELVTATRD